MKVTIDPDKCCGYGECAVAAPQLFQIGDDGRAHLMPGDELDGAEVALAREASYSCPVEAILVAE